MSEIQEKPAWKVGDKASFAVVRERGNGIRVSNRDCKIVEIYESRASVRLGNGRTTVVNLSDLTPASEHNAVTKLAFAMAGMEPPEKTPWP